MTGALIVQSGDARPPCRIGSGKWDLEDFYRYDVEARLSSNQP